MLGCTMKRDCSNLQKHGESIRGISINDNKHQELCIYLPKPGGHVVERHFEQVHRPHFIIEH